MRNRTPSFANLVRKILTIILLLSLGGWEDPCKGQQDSVSSSALDVLKKVCRVSTQGDKDSDGKSSITYATSTDQDSECHRALVEHLDTAADDLKSHYQGLGFTSVECKPEHRPESEESTTVIGQITCSWYPRPLPRPQASRQPTVDPV